LKSQKKISNRKSKILSESNSFLLKDYHFTIDTQNTFPHSSGIASSASGMAVCDELHELRKR
jgi:mevalonate pyrophosphate decarboxylase